ncbi:glycosyltransferase [Rothia sp. ARF10]|nr:glycosyltransferase [Rothia sp. ARF10]
MLLPPPGGVPCSARHLSQTAVRRVDVSVSPAPVERTGAEPLVSVVIPVHNVEHFLTRCVHSVLRQTHSSLDVVLVDDGSTDGSGAICDELARSDARVRVVHRENGGLSVARNTGLDVARGSHITFLDADDWLAPTFVERLLVLMTSSGANLAACALLRTHDPDAVPPPHHTPPIVLGRDDALRHLNGARHTVLTVACGKIFTAGLLTGLRFPPGRLHEDEFTTWRALAAADRVALTEEALYFYWQRSDSITGVAATDRNWRDVIDAYTERLDVLRGTAPPDVVALSNKELFRKLLHYRHWLPASATGERGRVLKEMRSVVDELRGGHTDRRFQAFAELYVRAPKVVGPAYAWYLRRLPNPTRATTRSPRRRRSTWVS